MIEFKSKFDKRVTKDFSNWQLKRISWLFVLFSLLIVLLGLLVIVSGEEGSIVGGIVLIIVGIGFFPLIILVTRISQKSYDKTMLILSSETEQVFQFYEDRIVVEVIRGEDFNERLEVKYNLFFKVYEEKEFYIFYISRTQAYLVHKDRITEGTFGELDNILKKNLKDKFKYLKK